MSASCTPATSPFFSDAGTHETSTFTQGTTTCTFSADVHATDLDPFTGTGHFQYENVSFVCS